MIYTAHEKHSCIQHGIWIMVLTFLLFSKMIVAVTNPTCQEQMLDDVTPYIINSITNETFTKDCSLGFYPQLPFLNLTLNCTAKTFSWSISNTSYTHHDIFGNFEIRYLQFDYNYTNTSSGKTVSIGHIRNTLATIKDHYDITNLEKDHITFGACIKFEGYPCWIWNEQVASCNDASQVPHVSQISTPYVISSTPSYVMISSTPSSVSSQLVQISSVAVNSSSHTSSVAINSSSSVIISTSVAQSSSSSVTNNKQATVTIVIIISIIAIIFVLVLLVVVCVILLWRRQLLTTRQIKQTKLQDAYENYDGSTTIQIDTLSRMGSFLTIYEPVDFSLVKIPLSQNDNEIESQNGTQLPSYSISVKRDLKLLEKPDHFSSYLNAVTDVDRSRTTSTSSYLRSPVDDYDDLFSTKFTDDNETAFSEAMSDLDGSVNMCDEEMDPRLKICCQNTTSKVINNKECNFSGTCTDDDYISSGMSVPGTLQKCNEEKKLNSPMNDDYIFSDICRMEESINDSVMSSKAQSSDITSGHMEQWNDDEKGTPLSVEPTEQSNSNGYVSRDVYSPGNVTCNIEMFIETSFGSQHYEDNRIRCDQVDAISSIGCISPDVCLQESDKTLANTNMSSDTGYISSSISHEILDQNQSTEVAMPVYRTPISDTGYISSSFTSHDQNQPTTFHESYDNINSTATSDSGYLTSTTYKTTNYDESTEFQLPVTSDACYNHYVTNKDLATNSVIDNGYIQPDQQSSVKDIIPTYNSDYFSLTETNLQVLSENQDNDVTKDISHRTITAANDGYIY